MARLTGGVLAEEEALVEAAVSGEDTLGASAGVGASAEALAGEDGVPLGAVGTVPPGAVGMAPATALRLMPWHLRMKWPCSKRMRVLSRMSWMPSTSASKSFSPKERKNKTQGLRGKLSLGGPRMSCLTSPCVSLSIIHAPSATLKLSSKPRCGGKVLYQRKTHGLAIFLHFIARMKLISFPKLRNRVYS